MELLGVGLLGGLSLSLVLVGLIGLLVVLVLRRDGDDDGSRAPALYVSLVSLTACFTMVFGATAMVSSLASINQDDDDVAFESSFDDEFSDDEFSDDAFSDQELFDDDFGSGQDADDAAIASAVQAALITAAAAAVFWFHRGLLGWAGALDRARPGGRVYRAYGLLVCLVAVVLVLFGAASGIYELFRTLAPGVTGADDRVDGVRGLLPMLVLVAGSAVLFRWQWDGTGMASLVPPTPSAPAPDPAASPTSTPSGGGLS